MYLDPNFGSMIIQLIIGLIAGVGAYFVIFSNRVSSLFFKRKSKTDKLSEEASEVKDGQ